jgi:Zn ribbon nucleic-acid-binding protein
MDDEKVEQSGPPQLQPLTRKTLTLPPCPACGSKFAAWDLEHVPVSLRCPDCGFHTHRSFVQWWAFDALAQQRSNATDV